MPSIVVIDLPLSDNVSFHMFPSLGLTMVEHIAHLEKRGADVHYFADIPKSAIIDVWQPGSTDYTTFPALADL
ncbi:MAG: hypothetical protein L0G99_02400 [Propionibacteriales bacterium]|nr:hypothetical protein [Propionibacteriales bacterium]